MSAPVTLEFSNVVRRYGRRKALDQLSFNVPAGAVCAFVGANGAGKTTSFSIVGNFIRAHGGAVLIDGKSLKSFRAAGGVVGLLPQDVQFFEDRTVARQLTLFCKLAGMNGAQAREEVAWVLELVQLSDRADSYAHELSHGMRVRLALAQALVGSPALVLLDEPTAGLDPLLLEQFRLVVNEVRKKTTLLISSHDLRELQTLCDYAVLISSGKLERQGTMQELLGKNGKVRFTLPGADLAALIPELSKHCPRFAFSEQKGKLLVTFDTVGDDATSVNQEVLHWLIHKQVAIQSVDGDGSLEEIYLQTHRAKSVVS